MRGVTILRAALFLISGFGCWAGLRLSIDHVQHGEVCPMIGLVPACIVVCLGYFAVFVSAFIIRKPASRAIFLIGWTPIFILAFLGVSLELTKGHICPPGPANIPQCFYSLAMAVSCAVLFWLLRAKLKTSKG